MATLTCKCNAVEIKLSSDDDLFRNQCCCHDCSAALWYAHQRGGPSAPTAQCVDSSWFANDFEIVRGENHLAAFMNFANADTTRFYCRECWTVIFADHPVYETKVIVTQMAAYTTFEGLRDATLMPVQSRHFVADVAAEEIANLPAWPGDPSAIYSSVSEQLMASFPAMKRAGGAGREMNAQILLQAIGEVHIPNGASRLNQGPATLMQQAAAGDANAQ